MPLDYSKFEELAKQEEKEEQERKEAEKRKKKADTEEKLNTEKLAILEWLYAARPLHGKTCAASKRTRAQSADGTRSAPSVAILAAERWAVGRRA